LRKEASVKEITEIEDDGSSTRSIFDERWTLRILQVLTKGPARFNWLARTTGINPNTLRERLRKLENEGLLDREVLSLMPPKVEYRLTEGGNELAKILDDLDSWVRRYGHKAN
jgi:DNA-binding HxlR family transcriptional regulator